MTSERGEHGKTAMRMLVKRIKGAVLSMMSPQRRFERIHRKNLWGSSESISGYGSTLEATNEVRSLIEELIRSRAVSSVVDAPCGDFNWMSEVVKKFPELSYIGIDIVPAIIEQDCALHTSDNVQFLHGDITTLTIPKADLIINRDCLMHLSYGDIERAIKQFNKSGSSLLLSTTWPNVSKNQDITTGQFRPINLQRDPFNFPEPNYLVFESKEPGRAVAVWQLPIAR
jgi:SAM-dependent methyltransferase